MKRYSKSGQINLKLLFKEIRAETMQKNKISTLITEELSQDKSSDRILFFFLWVFP